jgi:hypothetical protein
VRWLVKILKHTCWVLNVAASLPIPRPPLKAKAHAFYEAEHFVFGQLHVARLANTRSFTLSMAVVAGVAVLEMPQ